MAEKDSKTGEDPQKKNKSSDQNKENMDPTAKKQSATPGQANKVTRAAAKRASGSDSTKQKTPKTDSASTVDSQKSKPLNCSTSEEVKRILGLFPKDTQGLPKIPKILPAAASGSQGTAPQDPRLSYVPGSYTLHSTPRASRGMNGQNNNMHLMDYREEESDTLPVFDPNMNMFPPHPMFYSPPPYPMWDPSFYWNASFDEEEQVQPAPPAPFQYPEEQQANYQEQNPQPQPDLAPVQPQVAPQAAQPAPAPQKILELPEDIDEEAILDLAAPPQQQPGPGDLVNGQLVQGPPNNPAPAPQDQGAEYNPDWMEDEIEEQEEEVGPPLENDKFPQIFDAIWNQPISNPSKNRMKKIYSVVYRPNNVNNIVKTQVNPLVKNALPKEAFKKDSHPKSIQTAVIKGALAVAGVMDKLEAAPHFDTKREVQVKLLQTLRCLSHASNKTNELRRKILKPHLDKKFHPACDKPKKPSHLWLFGEDVVEELKEAEQVTRIERSLSQQKRGRRGRNYNSFFWSPYAYNYWSRGFVPRGRRFFGRGNFSPFMVLPGSFRSPSLGSNQIGHTKNLRFCVEDLASDNHIDISKVVQKQNLPTIVAQQVQECLVSNVGIDLFPRRQSMEEHQVQGPSPWQQRRQGSQRQPEQQQLAWLRHDSDTPDPQVRDNYIQDLNIEFLPFRAGGVAQCLPEWKKLTSDQEILNLVQGVRLDFKEPPIQDKIPNEIKFNREEEPLVIQELERFLDLGILEKSSIQPGDFVSNLFTRPKKEPGRLRIIANLKNLNKFIKFVHFKLEGIEAALQLVQPGAYMVNIDLENSYYSLKVHPEDTKYLKFICFGQIYRMVCLPMGYSQSALVFCKLIKVPLAHLRHTLGMQISSFIDDLFQVELSFEQVRKFSIHTIILLMKLGYTINVPKSLLYPSMRKVNLGLVIDTKHMIVTLTQDKIDKLTELAHHILDSDSFPIRSLSSLIGQMNAARHAVYWGPLHTKALEIQKNKALLRNDYDFDAIMTISQFEKTDITWWLDHIQNAFVSLSPRPITHTIFTDASGDGFGYFQPHPVARKGGGRWSEMEKSLHINVKEIKSVHLAILALLPDIENAHIKVFCDSQVAIFCIRKFGSTRSLACNAAVRNLLLMCENKDLRLTMTYLGTKDNIEADYQSRNFKNPDTEWSLRQDIFETLCSILQISPEIDMFAERLNAKLPDYCAWELDPHAKFFDAFTVEWEQFNAIYCFPCFSIIHQVLTKFQNTTRELLMLMIVPAWHTQSWYTRVLNLMVKQPIVVKVKSETLKLEHNPAQQHPMVGRLYLLVSVLSNNPIKSKAFLSQWQRSCVKPDQDLLTNNIPPISQGGKHIVIKGKLIPIIQL